jgi:hypothetical protein
MDVKLGAEIDVDSLAYGRTYYAKHVGIVKCGDAAELDTIAVYRGRMIGEHSIMGGGRSDVISVDLDRVHVYNDGEWVNIPGTKTFIIGEQPTSLSHCFHSVSFYAV